MASSTAVGGSKHVEFPEDDHMRPTEDEVVFKIHYKGSFEYEPLKYVNGYVNLVSAFAKDKPVFGKCLNHILDEIEVPIWAIFYRRPKKTLEKGLKLLHTDNDVLSMFDAAIQNGSINLYVAHKQQNLGKYYYKNMEWKEEDAGLRCRFGEPFNLKKFVPRMEETGEMQAGRSKRKKCMFFTNVVRTSSGCLNPGSVKAKERMMDLLVEAVSDDDVGSDVDGEVLATYKRGLVNGKAKFVVQMD